jgi:hypothetical protein
VNGESSNNENERPAKETMASLSQLITVILVFLFIYYFAVTTIQTQAYGSNSDFIAIVLIFIGAYVLLRGSRRGK